jgi:AcrR family transcriptional regulator
MVSPSMGTSVNSIEATADDEVHERVVRAATKCFRKWGLRKTTMGDIADEAGMLRPHLYRYFGSKEALIARAIIREASELNRRRVKAFKLRGPVAPLIVDVLADGHRTMIADEFLGQVVLGDGADLMLRLLIGDPDFIEAEAAWWRPTLSYGRKRSEIRRDLTDDDIIGWFLISQMALTEHHEYFADDASVKSHLEKFIVPAILA